MRRVIPLFAVTLAALAPVITGCGRNASREDCELIVNRNIEVQLKAMGVSDDATIQKRTGELRAQMKPDIDECVGKRITEGMIACVKGADTAEAITKCMR